TLSSGEKQKVAVASAAAMAPAVYVLDEPSANLDMAATKELAGILGQLKENGSTIVIAEHRLYYLTALADRIVYMTDGKIRTIYTAGQLRALTEWQLEKMGLRATKIERNGYGQCSKGAGREGSCPFVSIRDLCLRAGKNKEALLSAISFDIFPGEIAALTGANGAGKTTLARTLCGLAKEAGGKILYERKEVKTSARFRQAWFVMQETDCQLFSESVLGEMTVGRTESPALTKKAEKILKELDLWIYRERHPASLSGGQKQRLTLAVALMQETGLLILDEPTSGLDGRNLEKVVYCIKKQAAAGRAILVITHDHELVQKACTRMLYLKNGTLEKDFLLKDKETFQAAVGCLLEKDSR
ncbi:MAG TPA: ATP-binding cassette domain-containing protein, partial [Lachnospiraceae bacterium]|nr:ATP-binding cassette domain-containing protein [Lachnospiraceae bacterium]